MKAEIQKKIPLNFSKDPGLKVIIIIILIIIIK
jgi:hypothetical protein